MYKRNYSNDQNQTINLFSGIVKPLLLQIPEITEIIQLEQYDNVKSSIESRLLDLDVGADYILISKHTSGVSVISLMASRIQQNFKFDTFTIRYERRSGTLTEYIKRKIAISEDYCFPQLTLQAYITNHGTVRNACLIKTRSLYSAIERGLETGSLIVRGTPAGENWSQRFIAVPFNEIPSKRIIFNQECAIELDENGKSNLICRFKNTFNSSWTLEELTKDYTPEEKQTLSQNFRLIRALLGNKHDISKIQKILLISDEQLAEGLKFIQEKGWSINSPKQ